MPNNRKKKQHYVPQCYLENWAIENTHQINVYDKVKKGDRQNNITDVASENYFYDIDYNKAFSEDEKRASNYSSDKLKELSREQYIENFFADSIENELSMFLKYFKIKAEKFSKKKHFISKFMRKRFSIQLAYQHIRTKATRTTIDGMSDCLQQMLIAMNASEKNIKSFQTTKNSTKLIHGQIITDKNEIKKIAQTFNKYIWILAINKTNNEFYTTDNPISTRPHIAHQFMSMSGLASKGVEVFYPISPQIILIMFEREYHKNIENLDRHYFIIDNEKTVDSYNALSAIFSTRFIFSKSGDFQIINELLEAYPAIFDKPKVSLYWNGQTYYPQKK
jgi:hypothetical protein